MILIGSQALNYYIPIGRVMHDWDLIPSQSEYDELKSNFGAYLVKETDKYAIYDLHSQIIEIKNPNSLDPTDQILLDNEKNYKNTLVTEYGTFFVPDIQTLYDIKRATVEVIDEPKHHHDTVLIEYNFPIELGTDFFKARLKETQERVTKENQVKYEFFHKYHIPEYILHDRLHEMISDLLDMLYPTYKRITTAETNISEELFNNLTHPQKVALMMEESLVLNLERWFIPQMVENGINYRLIDKFYNNNEAMPTYKILKHVCLTGLKGEAKYITDFSKANFFEIERTWIDAKDTIKKNGGFPDWFYQELFAIRKKYRNGEKVGCVASNEGKA